MREIMYSDFFEDGSGYIRLDTYDNGDVWFQYGNVGFWIDPADFDEITQLFKLCAEQHEEMPGDE